MSDKEVSKKKESDLFDDLYHKMEKRIKDLSEQIKDTIIPDTEERLKKNVFTSIFFSFGAGFILGIVATLYGINRGKKKK